MTAETPFPRLASILRASSPKKLDFPAIYALARRYIEIMFRGFPQPLGHLDHLEDALTLANDHDLPVSYVTTDWAPNVLICSTDSEDGTLCFGRFFRLQYRVRRRPERCWPRGAGPCRSRPRQTYLEGRPKLPAPHGEPHRPLHCHAFYARRDPTYGLYRRLRRHVDATCHPAGARRRWRIQAHRVSSENHRDRLAQQRTMPILCDRETSGVAGRAEGSVAKAGRVDLVTRHS